MTHSRTFLSEIAAIANQIDPAAIEVMVGVLTQLREKRGRLFILGVGGSAGNAGHAVNDFRKLCAIEAYAPTDNVSELTARTNDEGWETVFSGWLTTSHMSENDAVLVFSVGGGNLNKNVSPNIVRALDAAKVAGTKILGIVGRDGGYTKMIGDCVVVVPTVNSQHVTPHSEAFQSVLWHCLVSHPALQVKATKW